MKKDGTTEIFAQPLRSRQAVAAARLALAELPWTR